MRGGSELKLTAGARVAVVGGGPAGSLFAWHLLRQAQRRALNLEVTIFEPKDFNEAGPAGCNPCAGVLSSRLLRNLRHADLTLPESVIRSEVASYVFHLAGRSIEIPPPSHSHRVLTVYRGGGPLEGHLQPEASFDAWLLAEAQSLGAKLVRQAVKRVQVRDRAAVETAGGVYPCDLVVLAVGVNGCPPQLQGLKYRAPPTQLVAQCELPLAEPNWHRQVHIYFGAGSPHALLTAQVPKSPYVSFGLLNRYAFVPPNEHDWLGSLIGESAGVPLCRCQPKIAVGIAADFYADRFVAIGDAAVTRLYKVGIGAAFLTAHRAAHTAIHIGISAVAFARGYAPLCRFIDRDNRAGQVLFALWHYAHGHDRVGQAWLRLLDAERARPAQQRHLHRALWNAFTGDDLYANILQCLLKHVVAAPFLAALFTSGHSGSRLAPLIRN